MNPYEQISKKLGDFIAASPSCYHVISNCKNILKDAGAEELREDRSWKLIPGKTYYVDRAGSSVIAFRIPAETAENFQIVSSHSDAPTFKIKEHEEMKKAGHYIELNVEKYGGALCAPWFDRPLSIAGRVITEEEDSLKTKLIDFKRDLVMLPSLAIHMNRQVNDSASYKIQTDMLPIFGDESSEGSYMNMVAELSGVEKNQILGTDLFLYPRSSYSIWGAHNEYFSSPKLDDLQCAFSSLEAFLSGNNEKSITICGIFDNEEVGSGTKQGADSTFLSDVMERITGSLGYSREKHLMMIASGFMLSADNAHAVHPNHIDKACPTNQPFMNEGVVIKFSANQKYTTDAVSAAVFRSICKKAEVPVQVYVNHSDVPGGSTLGNISNAHVSLNTVDIGCPQLAMHSPYETTGIKDTYYMKKAMESFYSLHISRSDDGNYTIG